MLVGAGPQMSKEQQGQEDRTAFATEKWVRLIDANVNRAAEGVRVVEDVARLVLDNKGLSADLRQLRHDIRAAAQALPFSLTAARDPEGDVGRETSAASPGTDKSSVLRLVAANFKRTQEALRAVEEALRHLGHDQQAGRFEDLRFKTYAQEKLFTARLDQRGQAAERCGIVGAHLPETALYCLTAEEYSRGRSNLQVVREMLSAGVKIIQYREKYKTHSERYSECLALRRLTREAGAVFLVNDHVDLALAVEADGVHLGQDDLPVPVARRLLGPDKIIGKSTHSPKQAREAFLDGVDYVAAGPIFPTSTKEDVCDPVGLEYLDYVLANIPLPCVAIGGIKVHNIAEVSRRRPAYIALVTEIVGAECIPSKIKELQEMIAENQQ